MSALAWGWAVAGQVLAAERYEFTKKKMGADFTLTFYADDQEAANQAAAAAYRRIDELNMIFSDYEPESEISLLSKAAPTKEPVKLSKPLWAVLSRAQALSADSDGAFDVTVGPVVKLWRQARRTQKMPEQSALETALAAVGYRHMQLDAKNHTAMLDRPRMQIDLGGIAMGYTVDEILKLLADRGIRRALVNGSGDIGLGDPPPGQPGWTIGIAARTADGPPERYVVLANCAITTSGGVFQHVVIGGVRYSHIVDPKTGLGLTDQTSVTLIAPNCMLADSVTKAIAVSGPAKGLKVVEKIPGAEVLIRRMVGEKLETVESPGFKKFDAPSDSPTGESAPAAAEER